MPSRCPVMRLVCLVSSLITTTRGFVLGRTLSAAAPIWWPRAPQMATCAQRRLSDVTQLQPTGTLGVNALESICATTRAPLSASTRSHLCSCGKGSACRKRAAVWHRFPQPRLSASASESDSAAPVLILGAGWVGSRLAQSFIDDGMPVFVTNRPGTDMQTKPPYFRPVPIDCPPGVRLDFDLSDSSTWDVLPPAESLAAVVLTFSVTEPPEAFWDSYLSKARAAGAPVLVYSTTSVYQVDVPGQSVDETTPLRDEIPRAQAENLLQKLGATVLTISGIFGDKRTPRAICTCLSTYTSAGGALNGRKQLNMVHVDDIIAATRACIDKPQAGSRINVAGNTLYLSQLIQHCKHPPIPDAPDTDRSSKSVSSAKLLNDVMPEGFAFQDAISS